MANIDTLRTILSNDLVAKWVNISDYAQNTLYSKSDIANLMDEIDKYGYGNWVEQNIATNTSKASADSTYDSRFQASKAFNNQSLGTASEQNYGWVSASGNGHHLDYDFGKPVKLSKIEVGLSDSSIRIDANAKYKIQGSNDGFVSDIHNVTNEITGLTSLSFVELEIIDDTPYRYYRLLEVVRISFGSGWKVRYYAYGPKGNAPIMTANNAPYGTAFGSSNYASSGYEFYRVFDGQSDTAWTPSSSDSVNNCHVGYKSNNPINVKRVLIDWGAYSAYSNRQFTASIQGSNNGTTYVNLKTGIVIKGGDVKYVDIENDDYYLYHRLLITATNQQYIHYISICSIQFYGRELKASVPIMTANDTPYGKVVDKNNSTNAFMAFDGVLTSDRSYSTPFVNRSTPCNEWIGYDFKKPVCIKMLTAYMPTWSIYDSNYPQYQTSLKLAYSDDGENWTMIGDSITFPIATKVIGIFDNNITSRYWAVCFLDYNRGYTPTSKGACTMGELQFYGFDYSEKEFAQNSNRLTIYDHGIEFETLIDTYKGRTDTNSVIAPTYHSDSIEFNAPSTYQCSGIVVSPVFDLSDYDYLHMFNFNNWANASTIIGIARVAGDYYENTNRISEANSDAGKGGMLSLDISSIEEYGTVYVAAINSRHFDVTEIWLE